MRAPTTLYAVQLCLLAAFLLHMPALLILFCMGMVLAAVVIKSKRLWRWLRMPLFAVGLSLIWTQVASPTSVEAVLGLLLVAVSAKLTELESKRDVYVVLCTSLFALGGLFLLDQSLITTLMVVAVTLGVLRVMMLLSVAQFAAPLELKQLGLAVLFSIPLLALLFVFFPRLPPIWSVPLAGANGVTGMSDTMSPGDIANLSQSYELAFRVFFEGETPSRSELYFRGLVFDRFNGTTWDSSGGGAAVPLRVLNQIGVEQVFGASAPVKPYVVRMEPTNQNWLFALDVPIPLGESTLVSAERLIQSTDPIYARKEFALGYMSTTAQSYLSDQTRAHFLTLPTDVGAKTKQLARVLRRQSGSEPRFVSQVLEYFNQQQFYYTLQPKPLAGDRIDGFMFNTMEGFCEHYASAFTFMMRAAGVPARVVVGYQGGNMGSNQSWEVRQRDAHAWSEVLINNRWIRVDPTAAVAPERVNVGMEQYVSNRGTSLFGSGPLAAANYGQYQLFSKLQRLSDQAEFFWQQNVVDYDQDKQKNGLFKALSLESAYQLVLILILGFSVLLGAVYWWANRRRLAGSNAFDHELEKLSAKLKRLGLARDSHQGVLDWLGKLEAKGALQAGSLAKLYYEFTYTEGQQPEKKQVKQLCRSTLKALKASVHS